MRASLYQRALLITVIIFAISGCQSATGPSATLTHSPATKRIHYHAQSNAYPKNSIWPSLVNSFQLPHHLNQPLVQHYIHNDYRYPDKIYAALKRSEPYLYDIMEQIKLRGMPTELALLPLVESRYKPTAVSHSGAVGMWQLMPKTAQNLHVRPSNYWYKGRQSVSQSTHAALDYLQQLYWRFDHDWLLAIAAYNAGEGKVQSAVDFNARHGIPIDFWHLDLPRETQHYVPKLLAISAVITQPNRYGFKLPYIANQPVIGHVTLHHQMDLGLVASLAQVPVSVVYRLNPQFTRLATPPQGTYSLTLPASHIAIFEHNLAHFPAKSLVDWRRYVVKKGDTLSHIAWRFGTSVNALKQANHLVGNSIYPGQSLVYPINQHNRHYHQYVVKSGDTLSRIAHKEHVTVHDLMHWNHLSAKNILHPGQMLWIH